jgi:hypothetical protein
LSTNGSGTLSWATASSADPSSADGDSLGTASLEWSDLYLADGGVVYFGNDQDVALIHNADTDIGDADVIGKIEFQAPDEGSGTDAILVGAAIQAVAVGDFSSSANAMELQFMTAESATASAKMRIRGDGKVGISPDGNAPDLGTGLHIRTSDSSVSSVAGQSDCRRIW